MLFCRKTLSWPDQSEWKEISYQIKAEFHFLHCVGFIDGMHLSLAYKPEVNGEEYWTCKHQYVLNSLLICDDALRMHHLHLGWPGSVHDNHVWRNSNLFLQQDAHFGPQKNLLGDSAFNNSHIMVSAYKKVAGQASLQPSHAWFNDKLSSLHAKVENVIGIWKGRFQFLCSIHICMKNWTLMVCIIKYVKASAILHNLLVNHTIPEDWISPDGNDNAGDDDFPDLQGIVGCAEENAIR